MPTLGIQGGVIFEFWNIEVQKKCIARIKNWYVIREIETCPPCSCQNEQLLNDVNFGITFKGYEIRKSTVRCPTSSNFYELENTVHLVHT